MIILVLLGDTANLNSGHLNIHDSVYSEGQSQTNQHCYVALFLKHLLVACHVNEEMEANYYNKEL